MTLFVNGLPASSSDGFSASAPLQPSQLGMQGDASGSTGVSCRKRKDLDDGAGAGAGSDLRDEPLERQTGIKNIRRAANMPRTTLSNGINAADEEAQFHPLPHELNMQLLANLGYLTNNNPQQQQHSGPVSIRTSHSPTSSFSDFGGPSTPADAASSAESYFTKGMRRDSSISTGASYPDFKFYPDERVNTPGLLGMDMAANSASADSMQMDDSPVENQHGPQCKSIPQLHVRSEPGIYSELWAKCPDCGSMSKVETPSIGDALSYSP